ncbi:MAG: 2-oxo-tetronate isomerase [Casimicrobiaceae bacterium]
MPRFAANLSFLFQEVDFPSRFGAAANAGFRAVEFAYPYAFDPRDLAERAREHQLEVVLLNAPPGDHPAGERGLASIPGRERDFAASIDTALRYADILQCKRVHVMAGVVPPEADAEERHRRRELYVRHLRHACVRAGEQGVDVLIEPLNGRDAPGYLLSTQADAHAICDDVGLPNLKVQFDLYHAQLVEGDLSGTIRHHLPQIGHIQVAGVPDRHEPDLGEVHYPWLFRLLDDLGYAGWIGCEYRPLHTTLAGLGWVRPWLTAAPPPRSRDEAT